MNRKLLALAAALAALVSGDALAAPTSDFTVKVTVNKACSIVTTNLDFGTYDPFSGSATPVANPKGVTLTCSKGTPWTVSLSTGGGAFATRTMKGTGTNTDTLKYNIYVDSGGAQIWGDGTSSTATVSSTAPDKLSHDVPMYGQITSGQDVTQDAYTDTITATVTF
jgi:spore coat protein U-like protein